MSASSTEKGFTLFVEVTILAGKLDEFFKHYDSMLHQITKEKGFLSIEVFRAEEKPNQLCWVENWSVSKSWFFENIITKTYIQQYLKATETLCDGERSVRGWERLGANYAIANPGVYQEPNA
ncbi:hypothetical protein FB567DRAFT_594801 [Paraphoma chrysanthemicola]|uniref:ABM domain-containing protein n=1 Tax=Paraphoma chrysanthemicola TaxID=798071 RepID=A0A8K0R208_9PLEO|nr:hypothetical protein FB567DRAFT_594801 [Paraphoma chrysanthemicola]